MTDVAEDTSTMALDPLPTPPIGHLVRLAVGIIVGFFAIFTLWGLLAPLDRAAIAPGELKVEGRRQVIQNLEGGIIAELAVRENQMVKAGDLLVRLDSTQTNSVSSAAAQERFALLAENARIQAELDKAETVTFPEELLTKNDDPRVAEIIANQEGLFQSRSTVTASRIAVIEQRMEQARASIRGFNSQITSQSSQLELLNEEEVSVRELVEAQLERKPRLLAIQRQIASTKGTLGELRASVRNAEQRVAQGEAEIKTLLDDNLNTNASRQNQIQVLIADLDQQLRAALDADVRREIYAPVDGQIVNMQHTTIGGVVGAGEPILELVPSNERLIVTAKLKPADRENVFPGLTTSTHLVPYSGRTVPRVDGVVTTVSQDTLTDPRSGQPYYTITVELSDTEAIQNYDIRLVSGMPAEVFVNLGSRSLLGYFFDPLRASFYRSFREG